VRRYWIAAALFVATSLANLSAQTVPIYSRLKLDTLYESWVNSATGQPVSNVISLDPANFKNQTLANPHVQYTDGNPDWLLIATATPTLQIPASTMRSMWYAA
jgi:hypothetical protein